MRLYPAFAVLIAATLAACAPSSVVPVPPDGTSPAALSIVAGSRPSARSAVDMFVMVVQTVEPVAERECHRRAPTANCNFLIVVDDNPRQPPNAFQTVDKSGRPILAFTLALLAEVQNPDELAFVMSHEVSHHILGHLERQRENATIGAAVFGQLAGASGTASPEAVQAAQRLGAAVGARTYSKEFELEADALGTVIAYRAGFDPVHGAEFFDRIPDPGNSFLSTHPANADRVALVRRIAAGLR